MSAVAAPAGAFAKPVRWPWIFVALFVSLAVAGSVLVVVNHESMLDQAPFIVAFGMFGVVGALVLSRVRRNPIGAALLYGSALTSLSYVGGELATWLAARGTTHGVVVVTGALLSTAGWILGILPVLLFLPLLFPDGRLPSARWRPLAWLNLGVLVFLAVAIVLGDATLTGSSDTVKIPNPFYLPSLDRLSISDAVVSLLLVGCLAAGVVSLIVRFRGADPVQRQQIKWVVASLVFVLFAFTASTVVGELGGNSELVDTILSGLAFISIPASIGVAVLQHRLYELDVVVRKTLIAGTLALVVIAVYATVVWLFGVVAAEGESSATVFVIALLLGVAFRPVTRFARRIADRFVYGRRATPYEVLTEFSGRVGEAYATDDVLGRMAQILGQGVGAETARVWLCVGGRLRSASSWPEGARAAAELTVDGDAMPGIPGELAVEVRDRGELLGALSVAMPANDPMTPAKERLVRDLASQAGLALRNVRLVEELKASQRRIVAAQDLERRRIERNIHDGAQQQLVALTVKMRLASSLATKDGEKAATMLEQMQAETQTALEDLRDLARGIYPPLLADQGLPAALQAQARKSAVPVDVSPDGVRRYPAEVEAAVYFSVLEALQNAAKYASATRVAVRLGEDGGWLTFEVEDDGRGFELSGARAGTGLQGIADRLAALDGSLDVRSRPGAGTVISGRVPVAARAADEARA